MVGSKPRRSARKREPPQKFEPTEASSPTRPAKRRKARASTPITLPEPEPEPEAEDQSEEEVIDDEDDLATQHEEADRVIPYLLEAGEPVNVQAQHPQTEHVVQAYAKIAGRNWQFHALSPQITIGRQGEKRTESESTDEKLPDIDLGPGKHVSREHAMIRYNGEDNNWHFKQLSRNGAKINFRTAVKQGQEAILMSGDVIEIAETEMIFMAPDVKAVVDKFFLDRMRYPVEHWEKVRPSQLHAQIAAEQSLPRPSSQSGSQYIGPMHISPYGPSTSEPGSSSTARPVTPNNPLLQHPYLAQTAQQMKPPSAGHGSQQPVTIEQNEQIDYSSDANKDIKPPMSYATLIAQAILAGPNEKSSLNSIYEWIKRNFAYYRHIDPSWQNSIRHNLSLNQAFQKAPRETHEPGKGGMWFIIPEKKDEYKRSGWKMTSRGGARPSSNPSSPAPNKNKSPKRKTPPRPSGGSSFAVQTPPSSHIGPSSQPSQTPLRQTTNASAIPKLDPIPQLINDNSPLPVRQSFLGNSANPAASPPMLPSSALIDDNSAPTAGYQNPFTPAPRRQEPSFNAPSTSKLPSQYLLQSSPAPFWKDFGTPAPLPQTSPVKVDMDGAADVPASSSPPRDVTNGSPTRPRVRSEVGLGIQSPAHINKDQPDSAPLDLMGNFPKIGDSRPTNAAH